MSDENMGRVTGPNDVTKENVSQTNNESTSASVNDVKKVKDIPVHNVRASGLIADPIRFDGGVRWMIYSKEKGQVIGKRKLEVNGKSYVCGFPKLSDNLLILPNGLGESVNVLTLFDEIKRLIAEVFVAPTEEYLTVMALTVLATWNYDEYQDISYLLFIGLPYCGKTRAIHACANLSFNCFWASGSFTSAAIIRMIDKIRGSVAIDEGQRGDEENNPSSEFHKLLVEGNQKNGVVLKCEGKEHEPKAFSVFSPKFLSARSTSIDEAVTSRMIEVSLERQTQSDFKEITDESWQKSAAILRNNLLLYRQQRVVGEKSAPGLDFVYLFKVEDFTSREKQVFGWLIKESPSEEVVREVIHFLKGRRKEMKELRALGFENAVLCTAYELLPINLLGFKVESRVSLKSVAGKLKENGFGDHTPKSLGKVLRDCGLRVKHFRDGNALVSTAVEFLSIFERLGLPLPEGSQSSPASQMDFTRTGSIDDKGVVSDYE